MSQFNISPDQIIAQAVHCGVGPGGCFGPLDLTKPTEFQEHFRSPPQPEASSNLEDRADESQRAGDEALRTQEDTRVAETSTPEGSASEESEAQQTGDQEHTAAAGDIIPDEPHLILESGQPLDADVTAEETVTVAADDGTAKLATGTKGAVDQSAGDASDKIPGNVAQTETAELPQGSVGVEQHSVPNDGEHAEVASRIVVDKYPVDEGLQPEGLPAASNLDPTKQKNVTDAELANPSSELVVETPEEASADPDVIAQLKKNAEKPVPKESSKPAIVDALDADSDQPIREQSTGQKDGESHREGRHEAAANKLTDRSPNLPKPGQLPPAAIAANQTESTAEAQKSIPTSAGNETEAVTVETSTTVTESAVGPKTATAKADGSADPIVVGTSTNHRSAAGTRESRSAERSVGRLTSTETSRFINRVAKAFDFAQERGGVLKLRLSPPELGSLRLEVTLKEGAVVARLEAETNAAKNVLMDNLAQLKERLAEQNIRIETFDVDVNDQPSSHEGAERQQDRENDRLARSQRTDAAESSAESGEEGTTAHLQRANDLDGELDLVA